jgi:hypothetical protein
MTRVMAVNRTANRREKLGEKGRVKTGRQEDTGLRDGYIAAAAAKVKQ